MGETKNNEFAQTLTTRERPPIVQQHMLCYDIQSQFAFVGLLLIENHFNQTTTSINEGSSYHGVSCPGHADRRGRFLTDDKSTAQFYSTPADIWSGLDTIGISG